jgi:hypothetical protein
MALHVSPALKQFVDDELLRAPLLFDQVVEGVLDSARRAFATMTQGQQGAVSDMLRVLQAERQKLGQRYLELMREKVAEELGTGPSVAPMPRSGQESSLSLVEEDAVALDIELSHTIQLIKSTAEQELRELTMYLATVVGDIDVSQEHNPFRPEAHARALWLTAQALPLSRGHQVAFLRHAGRPLAVLLRQSYAASCTRLEQMGIEPARYRTLILPGGSRRSSVTPVTTFSPDLLRMRETMPGPLDEEPSAAQRGAPRPERWHEIARGAPTLADRQAVELVGRLFEAMLEDERVPEDVTVLLSRLHGPAMRLALRDSSLLDKDQHPLWRLIHLLAYEAEMVPDRRDPERLRLLRLGQHLIDQLSAQPEQRTSQYTRAVDKLLDFLRQRLARRCAGAASQIGALQRLEERAGEAVTVPQVLDGVLDAQGMVTVPSELLPEAGTVTRPTTDSDDWLARLHAGHWVRLLLQGRWVHAQLLWTGAQRELWLFGDGGSDATWAVRRQALARLHAGGLAKSLKMRSLVGSAAKRVQQEIDRDSRA